MSSNAKPLALMNSTVVAVNKAANAAATVAANAVVVNAIKVSNASNNKNAVVEVAQLTLNNVKEAIANTKSAVSKNINSAYKCIVKKNGTGFYQKTPASKRAYPCPPVNSAEGKKGYLTEQLLALPYKPALTKSLNPSAKARNGSNGAVKKMVYKTLGNAGYKGGRRTRRN